MFLWFHMKNYFIFFFCLHWQNKQDLIQQRARQLIIEARKKAAEEKVRVSMCHMDAYLFIWKRGGTPMFQFLKDFKK